MPFAVGVFTLFATGNPVVTGTSISSTWANSTLSDIATGLSTAILKDGTQTITANIPTSGFKFTGLGSGTAATDSATVGQVQSNVLSYLTAVAGTNTITATATPAATLVVGQRYFFIASGTNTTATTLQIGANSAGAIQSNGAALAGGEIQSGYVIEVFVSAATPVFQLVSTGQILPGLDTLPIVHGSADATKKVRLEVDGLTTATTRVLTMLDADFSLGSATQAQQETSTSLVVSVTPGVQQFHPSAAKGWVNGNFAGGINASYNLTSITDTGTGQVTVTWNVDFSSSNYCTVVGVQSNSNVYGLVDNSTAPIGGAVLVDCRNTGSGALADADGFYAVGFGDQ